MSLWRKAPREVYRVYDEDEYLQVTPDWEDPHPVASQDGAPAIDSSEGSGDEYDSWRPESYESYGSRSRRIGGLALLVAVMAAASGLVAASVLRRPHSAPGVRIARGGRIGVDVPASAAARSSVDGSPEKRVPDGTGTSGTGRTAAPARAVPRAVAPTKTIGHVRAMGHAVAPTRAIGHVQERRLAEPEAHAPEGPALDGPASEAPAVVAPASRVDSEFGFER